MAYFQPVTLPVPFVGGIDTKDDPRQTPLAKLQELENANFDKPGSLRTRFGTRDLSNTIDNPVNPLIDKITDGTAVFNYRDELLITDPNRIYSYEAATDKWIDKGAFVSVNVTQDSVIRNSYAQIHQDAATHPDGLTLSTWYDSSTNGTMYSIRDTVSGATVKNPTSLGGPGYVLAKPIVKGDQFILYAMRQPSASSPASLFAGIVPVSNPTRAITLVEATGGGADHALSQNNPMFDACYVPAAEGTGDLDVLYLAFFNADNTVSLWGFTDDPANPINTTTFIDLSGIANCLTVFPAPVADGAHSGPVLAVVDAAGVLSWVSYEQFWLGTSGDPAEDSVDQISGFLHTFTISGISTSDTVANTFMLFLTRFANSKAATNPGIYTLPVKNGSTQSSKKIMVGMYCAGKAFSRNGVAYSPVIRPSAYDTTLFVLDSDGNEIVRTLAAQATGAFGGSGTLTDFYPVGTAYQTSPASKIFVTTPMQFNFNFDAAPLDVFRAFTLSPSSSFDETSTTFYTIPANGTYVIKFQVVGFTELVSPSADIILRIRKNNSTTVESIAMAPFLAADVQQIWQFQTVPTSFGAGDVITWDLYDATQDEGSITTTAGIGNTQVQILVRNTGAGILPEVSPVGDTGFKFSALIQDLLTTLPSTTSVSNGIPGTTNTVTYTQTGVVSVGMDFNAGNNAYQRAELADTLLLSGGFLQQYDGISLTEVGFNYSPEIFVSPSNTGGSLGNATQSTAYFFSATYEWTNNIGTIERSQPSVPVSVTFASGVTTGSVTVTVPAYNLTAKKTPRSPVTIHLYRTIGTSPGVFYDTAATTVPSADPATDAPLINDETASALTYIDIISDALIIGNPRLYTTGGVLGNDAVAPLGAITVYQNRLWGVETTNPRVLWYSQEVSPGVPVQFSDFLTFNLAPRIGGASALGVVDEKFIIFGQASTFMTFGAGPDATGENSTYADAQLITTDVGCPYPSSVAQTKDGLVFQSLKGIYLLNRSTGTDYIGAGVEDLVNDNLVTGATLVPSTNQIRFTLNSGIATVLDTFVGQWSSFSPTPSVGSVIWNGQWTWLGSDGIVRVETPDLYADNTTPIQVSLLTGPIRLNGIGGFQGVTEVMIIGTFQTAHNLEVSVYYDGNPAAEQTTIVSPDSPSTWGSDPTWGSGSPWGGVWQAYVYRVILGRTECESIQIGLKTLPTSAGAGVALSGLRFEVSVMPGNRRTPAKSTF